jgi:hypothetical protein
VILSRRIRSRHACHYRRIILANHASREEETR